MVGLQDFNKILIFISKSSYWRCSVKKVFFKNFTKLTGKDLYQTLFLNKVAGLRPKTIEKEILVKVFSCEFCEIFKNTSSQLLLYQSSFGVGGGESK